MYNPDLIVVREKWRSILVLGKCTLYFIVTQILGDVCCLCNACFHFSNQNWNNMCCNLIGLETNPIISLFMH